MRKKRTLRDIYKDLEKKEQANPDNKVVDEVLAKMQEKRQELFDSLDSDKQEAYLERQAKNKALLKKHWEEVKK